MKSIYLIILLGVPVALLVSPFLLYYGSDIVVVTSDSMAPALEPYDMIIVHKTSSGDIHVGDIIVFEAELDRVSRVVHRAIQVLDDDGKIGIITKGDNLESADPWIVHQEDLVGKVVSSAPRVGIFLLDPIRYALSAVIVITIVSFAWDVKTKPKISKR